MVIAAITSCTNTSNPSVMVGAALLAKNAVDRGLARKPWVKTTLAPGSKVVMDYYERAGLLPYLDKLGFNLVGYGCTTCIGNSGPLPPAISEAVNSSDLAVAAVLSGNRNFEGRINPDVKMNYLASPPLVVAYALAGTMDIDMQHEPLGSDAEGKPVYLADIWPSSEEIADVVQTAVAEEMFTRDYADVFSGDDNWRGLDIPAGDTFAWAEESTYVRRPPYFDGMPDRAGAGHRHHRRPGAGQARRLGDHRPHLSGRRDQDREPGGQVPDRARRGAERLQLLRLPPRQPRGDDPRHVRQHQAAQPARAGHRGWRDREGRRADIHLRRVAGVHRRRHSAIVLGGKEYGSGSSRDWAAKGTLLLGVRAVLVESFERIHRSNLIGMGVLPLQYRPGESAASLGLTGDETFDIRGIEEINSGNIPNEVTVTADDKEFRAVVRIDTPGEADYYRHGGIMQYVLRSLLRGSAR